MFSPRDFGCKKVYPHKESSVLQPQRLGSKLIAKQKLGGGMFNTEDIQQIVMHLMLGLRWAGEQ